MRSSAYYLNGAGMTLIIPTPSTMRIVPTLISHIGGDLEVFDNNSAWVSLGGAELVELGRGFAIASYQPQPASVTIGNGYLCRYLPSLDAEIY